VVHLRFFFDDEPATDAEVFVCGDHGGVFIKGAESHAIGMLREGFEVVEDQVLGRIKGDAMGPVQMD
jgi:hypothetical protein